MVGVGGKYERSVLARVSLVNEHNECVYDKFVKPREEVTDYRTFVSGVTAAHLKDGNVCTNFEIVYEVLQYSLNTFRRILRVCTVQISCANSDSQYPSDFTFLFFGFCFRRGF
jgi:hypothetical protein